MYNCDMFSNYFNFLKLVLVIFLEHCFWNNSRRNVSATQLCSTLHPNFRSGVSIARRCNNDGTWSPVNMAACTMFIDSNPVIAIHFTVVVSDSNTMDSTTILSNVRKIKSASYVY